MADFHPGNDELEVQEAAHALNRSALTRCRLRTARRGVASQSELHREESDIPPLFSRCVSTDITSMSRQGIGWASTVVSREAAVGARRHELVRSWRFIARSSWLVLTVAKGEMDTRPGDGIEVIRAEEGEGGRVDRSWRSRGRVTCRIARQQT